MKGIGILSVIIGHSYFPSILKDLIFTWHMPMFFIISGYFYKSYPNGEYIKRNICQLIYPYVITSLAIIGIMILKDIIKKESETSQYIIGALIGNGSYNNPIFSEYFIGAIWFLLALCWCRIIYNALNICITDEYQRNVTLVCLSCCAAFMGTFVFVPTNLLQGMQALLFFHVGYLWRIGKIQEITSSYMWGGIIILCILSVMSGSMSMVRCYYGFYPINVLASIGITIGLYKICTFIGDNLVSRFLAYCGRISLIILCVHNIEFICGFGSYLRNYLSFPSYSGVAIHLMVSLICSTLLLQIKYIRSLFHL